MHGPRDGGHGVLEDGDAVSTVKGTLRSTM